MPAGPPRYKLALLAWAGAYVVITVMLAVLGPAIVSWPLVLRTFVVPHDDWCPLEGRGTGRVMPVLPRGVLSS